MPNLARGDPVAAGRIMLRDRSRILRALEVLQATGRPIADWHRDGLPPVDRSGPRAQDFPASRSAAN